MQLLEYHVILGIIATVIGLIGYATYFKDIIKKRIKPHAFSWFIWGILQSLVFFAQTSKGAGAGAWAVGAPALLNFIIFVIAIFRGEKEITRLDKASLLLALLGIALWAITTDPLWSVIIATGVDVVGFVPTVRKSYKKPNEEAVTEFALSAISFGISLFALQSVNMTTVLYPASLVVTNTVFVAMVMIRRGFRLKPYRRKSKTRKKDSK
jgi:uncharacterized protein with PQ loop repeat